MERSFAALIATVQNTWTTAFARRDVAALVALYTQDAAFYGSAARLYRGRTGVRDYFSQLSPRFKRARFGEAAIVVLAPTAIAASGPVVFTVEQDGATSDLPYRMTHVLACQDGSWLIATHHASPAPLEG